MKIVLGAKGSQVNVIYACYIIISVPSIYFLDFNDNQLLYLCNNDGSKLMNVEDYFNYLCHSLLSSLYLSAFITFAAAVCRQSNTLYDMVIKNYMSLLYSFDDIDISYCQILNIVNRSIYLSVKFKRISE